jgi:thioredoxin reductase
MPNVPGFAEGWGTCVVPCPYCDGFEFAGQHWGLVWSGRHSHNRQIDALRRRSRHSARYPG